MTEILFEVAIDAKRRDCDEVAFKIRNLFLSWAFKAGKYQTGWGILENACCGLACMSIIFDFNDSVLLNEIEKKVSEKNAPSFEIRFRASEALKEKAIKYHEGRYVLSAIKAAMGNVDQNKLRALLTGIADKLVPEEIQQQTED